MMLPIPPAQRCLLVLSRQVNVDLTLNKLMRGTVWKSPAHDTGVFAWNSPERSRNNAYALAVPLRAMVDVRTYLAE